MDALGTFTQSVPFTFGVPFFLEMELRVFGFSHAIGIAEASGLGVLRSPFDWRGIDGVRFGDELVDFTLTSTSGTNWTQAFPNVVSEPSTHALLLLGLGLGYSAGTLTACSARTGKLNVRAADVPPGSNRSRSALYQPARLSGSELWPEVGKARSLTAPPAAPSQLETPTAPSAYRHATTRAAHSSLLVPSGKHVARLRQVLVKAPCQAVLHLAPVHDARHRTSPSPRCGRSDQSSPA